MGQQVTKRLLIYGRVQGVGYRYSMYYAAKNLGITGWVRNCRDGTVEAVAQGPEGAVNSFIEWAHQGPDLAKIDRVEVKEGTGEFPDFSVRETL